jgi:hypothetical protein
MTLCDPESRYMEDVRNISAGKKSSAVRISEAHSD